MIFSKTSEYAIRALAFLAAGEDRGPVAIAYLGRATGVPAPYIAKIFQGLAQAGVLISERGINGGYRFRKDPAAVTLLEVIEATDNLPGSPLSGCVMGFKKCSDGNPCALHPIWAKSREQMLEALRATSISDASAWMRKGTFQRGRPGLLSRRLRSVLKPA